MDLHITEHAYDRAKERIGLSKNATDRLSRIAFEKGIKHGETTGQLFRYISSQAAAYMRRGTKIVIYGENVFVYKVIKELKQIRLITVYKLPNNLKTNTKNIRKRKKNDSRQAEKEHGVQSDKEKQ